MEEILKETLCFILRDYVIQEWKQEVTQSVPILRNSEKNEGVPIPLKQSDYNKIMFADLYALKPDTIGKANLPFVFSRATNYPRHCGKLCT